MNPVVFETGTTIIRYYTAWLSGGIFASIVILTLLAYRRDPALAARWMDVSIAALIGGIVGARLLYVVLEWDYFTLHHDEISQIELGGMAWHGALLLGIPAALLVARLRRVSMRPWSDALALVWPLGMIAAWNGCRRAGCGYGGEVRTLADWPGWMVSELPDVYGLIAPRFEVQRLGMGLSAAVFGLILLLTWRNWLAGVRFWLMLALSGIGLYLIGFYRVDPAHTILDRRADQIFDLATVFFSSLIGGMIWIVDHQHTEETQHENQPGAGPDDAETGGRETES
jgi:phosphatidylglycerol:prolipoprotein diacylglycerol transferase